MKLKNILLSGLSLILVAALAIGGTVAYLQDEDSDVNVMTLGNVSIEQLEYERAMNEDGTYKTATIDNRTSYVLQPFTQGKALLPSALNTTTWDGWDWNDDVAVVRNSQVGSYGGMSVFKDAANAQDKFVYVKNTGKTDAYVRTLVAVEVGTSTIDLLGFNSHLGAWTKNDIGTITVDGNNYFVFEYVYAGAQLSDGSWRHENGVLPAGDMTYNSFAQVYIHSKATNEDMEKLDGNGNGTLDILVLSQAVQAAGFADANTALDTAFGESSEKAAVWFGGEAAEMPTLVTTVEELQAAIDAAEAGKKNEIIFNDDIAGDVTVTQKPNVTLVINGNGFELDGAIVVNGKSARYETAGVVIKNVDFTADSISSDACINLGKSGDNELVQYGERHRRPRTDS